MSGDRITIWRRSYLRGRKMNGPVMAFLAVRDLLIGPFFKAPAVPLPKGSDVAEICVCQIDHLGDLLMVTPLLVELRRFAPRARIILVVGRWCGELAEVLRAGGLVDECLTYTAWPLDPGRRNVLSKMYESWGTLVSAARQLRPRQLDIFFDLRPWSPNAWLLAHLSRAKLRVGYGLRGMADVYNCIPVYAAGKSTGQAHLDALQVLTGKSCDFVAPYLPPVPKPAHLPLPPGGYLVAQLFSREAARNIPVETWKNILQRLTRHLPIVLVGAAADAGPAGNLVDLPGVTSLIGRTSIPDLLGVIQESRGIISIDSFTPHAGLAYSKRVAVMMVKAVSNQCSFPQNNPGLKFFPAVIESGDAIEQFLASC